jgi:phage baseplate assembly protein W
MLDPFHALKYPVAIDSAAGRFARETDYDQYIEQLVKQVLLTAQGERINRPTFGAGVRQMVMAPNGVQLASLAQTLVYHALTTWLSTLIAVESVEAKAVDAQLQITVVYSVRARGVRRELTLPETGP